jgi:hypothetical protein
MPFLNREELLRFCRSLARPESPRSSARHAAVNLALHRLSGVARPARAAPARARLGRLHAVVSGTLRAGLGAKPGARRAAARRLADPARRDRTRHRSDCGPGAFARATGLAAQVDRAQNDADLQPKNSRISSARARASARPISISSWAKPPSNSMYEAQSASASGESRDARSSR